MAATTTMVHVRLNEKVKARAEVASSGSSLLATSWPTSMRTIERPDFLPIYRKPNQETL